MSSGETEHINPWQQIKVFYRILPLNQGIMLTILALKQGILSSFLAIIQGIVMIFMAVIQGGRWSAQSKLNI